MNLFEYLAALFSGDFYEDYAEDVRENWKAQAKKRREEDKKSEEE